MNNKICPFMGKACEYSDCALWNEAAAKCAFAVMAAEMQTISASTYNIDDNIAELNSNLPGVINAVKGLV